MRNFEKFHHEVSFRDDMDRQEFVFIKNIHPKMMQKEVPQA